MGCPEKVAFQQTLEGAVFVSEGKAFQAEGTATAQALVLRGWGKESDTI